MTMSAAETVSCGQHQIWLLGEDFVDLAIVSSCWPFKKIAKELFYLKTLRKVCLLSIYFFKMKTWNHDLKMDENSSLGW